MSAQPGGERTSEVPPVVIRFRDDEIVEGRVPVLDLDRPDFQIVPAETASNNRAVLIPLTAVKTIVIARAEFNPEPDETRLRKAAIRFWDGDVLKGYLVTDPVRHTHAMTLQLVSPALDEVETFAIPYSAVKAIFFIKAWDGRAPVFTRETGSWTLARADPPLLDLLGEIRALSGLRTRGKIGVAEFERRRREVLDRI